MEKKNEKIEKLKKMHRYPINELRVLQLMSYTWTSIPIGCSFNTSDGKSTGCT